MMKLKKPKRTTLPKFSEEDIMAVHKKMRKEEAERKEAEEEKYRKSLITNEVGNCCQHLLVYETVFRSQFYNTDPMYIPCGVNFEYEEVKTGNLVCPICGLLYNPKYRKT